MPADLKRQFSEQGFVVVRGLLSESEAAYYVARLDEVSGRTNRSWTLPDGVHRCRAFWPLLFTPRIVEAVREVLGPAIRYLPHNDLHVGFSSAGWHRDSVSRSLGTGSDWDETRESYRIARVGVYLHRYEESGFKLGLIPGTHRPDLYLTPREQLQIRRRTSLPANAFSWLSGLDLIGRYAEWVPTQPGDGILFDPRILHTGSSFRGRKYSIFVAYGLENRHFWNHWHYYVALRSDLGYAEMPCPLADMLQDAGLLGRRPDPGATIKGAWIPSPWYVRAAGLFK
jgi:hypothetical protein